ncbi:MAG: hypothetical protein ACETV1_05295 [Candidatus Bathyarchaeia archaeon]
MPLPDQYCSSCIRNFVPKDTKLSDLKQMGLGTCDSCGRDTTVYELPEKITGDWLILDVRVLACCVRCGKRLKIVSSRTVNVLTGQGTKGVEMKVERCGCG